MRGGFKMNSKLDLTIRHIQTQKACQDIIRKNFPDNVFLPENKEIKVGRNEPCPCDSGKKFKKCCLNKESE